MNSGYFLIALGQDLYFEMVTALAISIRYCGDSHPICLLTDNPDHPLLRKRKKLFDAIINVCPYVPNLVDQYNFKTSHERFGILPKLLLCLSPYDKSIFIDSDCMVVKSTEELWEISSNYNFTTLGYREVYPGWGQMTDAEINEVEYNLSEEYDVYSIHLREVHEGMIWFDKSEISIKRDYYFADSLQRDIEINYFSKVINIWNGSRNCECHTVTVMSLLDLPVVSYDLSIMSFNPDYYSVEKHIADVGDLFYGRIPHLKNRFLIEDKTPTVVHFFKKANDVNYWRNREFLFEWYDQQN